MTDPLIRSWGFFWAANGRSARTMREMAPFLERFQVVLATAQGGEQGDLTTATRGDCEEFIASHASPFRANYAWRSLRSFYTWWAEEREVISPMARVKAPRVPLTDVKVAEAEDISRLLRASSPFRTQPAARDAAIVSLLWATGLRRSELAALKVGDIDLATQTLVVQKAKNGKSRRVPFDGRSAQHLSRYLSKRDDENECLWIGKYGPLTSDGIRRVIERRRKVAGVTVSAHAFRRGYAARALRAGVSQPSLMALAGWETADMPARYVRGVKAELAEMEYREKMA